MPAKKRPKPRKKTARRTIVLEVHNGWTLVCEFCGEEFGAKRSDAKYCPRPKLCRDRAYRGVAKK